MKKNQLDKLVRGNHYVFVVLEEDPDTLKTIERTYIAEFRGWETHPEWNNFIIIWPEGESCGRPIYQSDVLNVYPYDTFKEKKLKYSPMWSTGTFLYHYHDKKSSSELKYVVMESSYFIRKWQIADKFAYAVFNDENAAEEFIATVKIKQ